jgi:hypothetical protein
MVKILYPYDGVLPDAEVLRMARDAYDTGETFRKPIDLEDAVELLRDAGKIRTPRRCWYFLGADESQYNTEGAL